MSTVTTGQPTGVETPDRRVGIALSPVAAPSVLGLFGFSAATFMVAANLAGWYGGTDAQMVLFPFVLTAGGIAQLLAGMWAYCAGEAVPAAMHGFWGSCWIGYGLYNLLIALDVLPAAASDPAASNALGFWFVVLAAITWAGAIVTTAENIALAAVLAALAAGSTLLGTALLGGDPAVLTAGALLLLVSAVLASYLAAALLFEAVAERVVLPIGRRGAARSAGALAQSLIPQEVSDPAVPAGW